ncbi:MULTISPECIES: alpha-glycosidase [unclassified Paenibacillus]|uniref:alpha-glycosidase n=1 Tax=unclassified Paenibacillus TaxID=185978 RepID=UPI002404DCBB|nr:MULTISPECIES: alpha-glycosidase [unclassified Paenibacillus]MDF9841683.1 cyclomaltodextrinase [Paenibacillus sp. PastF-2]MDF9848205.1 cyclomaltodextrinase [Paenibacillus sp. PastM-2]MDF9854842.1 cyclomaltodextrinase [Paenibacillus sp. PastF-1]MDH6480112.1 cyclomaltodextrinase [Paenibacillus sp. PastH-2]MDH6507544.1 cyclomaltodextrinase [Paenibacillus sp. PastM-3]
MISNEHAIGSANLTTNIHLESLHHVPHSNWAYPYDKETFHLRVRTKKQNVERVYALTGDKYDWETYNHEYEMRKIGTDRLFDYWQTTVKPDHRRFSYAFRFHTGEETVWMTENAIHTGEPEAPNDFYDWPYIHEIDIFQAPEWAKSAVFYQIMPERFANGDTSNDPDELSPWGGKPATDNFFGGDLQGIIDHLDYLEDLGITAIYLTPIFEAPTNHKYDTTDYMKVDPHFGDLELLKKLVDEAHAKGIRIVLDAVFNHIGSNSPQFKDVIEHGENSKYADWFHINEFPVQVKEGKPNYDAFGFFAEMPKLNTANPETREYLLNIAEYWLKELGMDGWRLDVANEIDHHFWKEFRTRIKAINPDAYIIGENWNDSLRWLHGDQFDSVMNYPLSDRLIEFLQSDDMDAQTFSEYIGGLLMRYPQQANEVLFNLLASHDTPRLLTQLGGDKNRLKLAVAFLLTFIGTPCIYYGDEIGLDGEGDPDCRKCMIWEEEEQDRDLYQTYKQLIQLRKDHPVLSTGEFGFLKNNQQERQLVYERYNNEEHCTVWMNPSPEPATLAQALEGNWKDAFTGESAAADNGEITLELEPFSFRILFKD